MFHVNIKNLFFSENKYIWENLIMNVKFLLPIVFIFLLVSCQHPAGNLNPLQPKKGKVKGIGGIFFKCKNPGEIKAWYGKNLGMITDEYGALFEFVQSDESNKKGYLEWSPFSENTTYFQPSEKEFMINYRVENIELLLNELRKNGVKIVDSIQTYEYGKFVHILDPENNKIELWEPVDTVFTRLYDRKTNK
jgi:predicted enzyme related to lactoylglutathione lyase